MSDTLETNLKAPATPLEREIADLGPWFHNLHLPDGTQTAPTHPLGDFPAFKWAEISPHLMEDLSGWRVLDVGCNAGFYSFQLARRGAEVTGIDVEPRYLEQARWAARKFELQDRVRFEQMQVYDLARLEERYDLIWFMGVFYHLRYPMLALDLLAERTDRFLVFQCLTTLDDKTIDPPGDFRIHEREMLEEPGWPRLAFIEHSFAGDPTNWWVPNHAGVEAMLRSAGLQIVNRPGHEIYICEPSANLREQNQYLIKPQLLSATGRRDG